MQRRELELQLGAAIVVELRVRDERGEQRGRLGVIVGALGDDEAQLERRQIVGGERGQARGGGARIGDVVEVLQLHARQAAQRLGGERLRRVRVRGDGFERRRGRGPRLAAQLELGAQDERVQVRGVVGEHLLEHLARRRHAVGAEQAHGERGADGRALRARRLGGEGAHERIDEPLRLAGEGEDVERAQGGVVARVRLQRGLERARWRRSLSPRSRW